MAVKLNTKFVVALVAGLLVLAGGVVALGLFMHLKKPVRLAQRADEAMAAGEYRDAAQDYGRAYGRDLANYGYLEKWEDALTQVVPQNTTEAQELYQQYFGILETKSNLRRYDAEIFQAYIEELDERVRAFGGGRQALAQIINAVTDRLDDLDEDDDATKRLLRYRGLATVDTMILITLEEEQREQAREDLLGAIEVDPTDEESRLALVRWHFIEADRHRRDARETEMRASMDAASAELAQQLEAMPDSLLLRAFQLTNRVRDAVRENPEPSARRAALTALSDEVNEVAGLVDRGGAFADSPQMLSQIGSTMVVVLGRDGRDVAASMINRRLEANPDDLGLRLFSGGFLSDLNRFERAVEVLEPVANAPDVPVSLESILLPFQRTAALGGQIDAYLDKFAATSDEAEKSEALENAKRLRERLADTTGDRENDQLLLRDARIARIEERYDEAIAKLAQLESTLGRRTEEMSLLLADCQLQKRNYGEARLIYEEIVNNSDQPDARAMMRLAETYVLLQQADRAIDVYEQALVFDPSNETMQQRLVTLKSAVTEDEDEQLDPIVRALRAARDRITAQDVAGAKALLEPVYEEFPGDLRLVQNLASIESALGNRERALEILDDGIAANPGSDRLRAMRVQLASTDPEQAARDYIASLDAPEHIKAIELAKALRMLGKRDEASAELARAVELAPDAPEVIEAQFLDAAGRQDLEEARRVVRRAAAANADQVDGLLFQGRLQLLEGDFQNALLSFEQVVQRVPYNPPAWRLLGSSQQQLGRLVDAVESYRRAYEGNPSDAQTAKEYAAVLIKLNRGAEALAVVEPEAGALRFVRNDPDLGELYLQLEAEFGDAAEATEMRERMFATDPSRTQNALALFRLYLEEERLDDAQSVIDAIGDADDVRPLVLTALRAQLLEARGDSEGALATYRSYVEDLPEDADDRTKLEGWLTYGEYLVAQGDSAGGVEAYEKARAFQAGSDAQADRRLGDHFFRMASNLSSAASAAEVGRAIERAARLKTESDAAFERAAQAYRAVLDSDLESESLEQAVAKRLAETHGRLRQFEEANAVLASVPSQSDAEILMLRSNIERSRGDDRAARRFLDEAVAIDPSDPSPFMQRALFNLNDETMFSDVLQDLDQVVRLRPGLIRAWSLRYQLYKRRAQFDQALAELRNGIEVNPDSTDLRGLLVTELLALGRMEEAQREALEVVERRPDDTRWLGGAARIFADNGQHGPASELFRRLYAMEQTPENAALLLDSLLRAPTTPSRAEVNRLRAEVDKIAGLAVGETMLIARANMFLGDDDFARNAAFAALDRVGDSGELARFWLRDVQLMFQNPNVVFQNVRSVIDAGRTNNPFLRTYVVTQRYLRGEDRQRVLDDLASIEATNPDPRTMLEIYRSRSRALYDLRRYDECLVALDAALEISPSDIELNNNYAYIALVEVGDAERALPHAEEAARLAPVNSTVLDTLGFVYLKLDRPREARTVLERALQTADAPREAFIAHVHLGKAAVELSDLRVAREHADAAEAIGREHQSVVDEFGEDLEELKAML
ncbi:MAG: tetratricopeptide repeat protein [Planctomycetota bacterium]